MSGPPGDAERPLGVERPLSAERPLGGQWAGWAPPQQYRWQVLPHWPTPGELAKSPNYTEKNRQTEHSKNTKVSEQEGVEHITSYSVQSWLAE